MSFIPKAQLPTSTSAILLSAGPTFLSFEDFTSFPDVTRSASDAITHGFDWEDPVRGISMMPSLPLSTECENCWDFKPTASKPRVDLIELLGSGEPFTQDTLLDEGRLFSSTHWCDDIIIDDSEPVQSIDLLRVASPLRNPGDLNQDSVFTTSTPLETVCERMWSFFESKAAGCSMSMEFFPHGCEWRVWAVSEVSGEGVELCARVYRDRCLAAEQQDTYTIYMIRSQGDRRLFQRLYQLCQQAVEGKQLEEKEGAIDNHLPCFCQASEEREEEPSVYGLHCGLVSSISAQLGGEGEVHRPETQICTHMSPSLCQEIRLLGDIAATKQHPPADTEMLVMATVQLLMGVIASSDAMVNEWVRLQAVVSLLPVIQAVNDAVVQHRYLSAVEEFARVQSCSHSRRESLMAEVYQHVLIRI